MALKPTKTKEKGKTVYRDGNGNKITSSQYTKQLKAYNDSVAVYSTKKVVKNGKTTTTYYKNGKKISKSAYQKATTNKDTYEMKTQNGKTTYYKNGEQISQKAYSNFTSSSPKPYTENGKYYDKTGKEISKASYDSQVKAIQDKQAKERATVSFTEKKNYTDQYRSQLEDLAKKYANQQRPTYEKEKAIVDNAKYISERDAIAKSLKDGSYFNPETDPRAQALRDQYTRQGRQAMSDTIADASKRTGGLASSYAAAAAAQSYNNYMDNLASKINIDLRQLAEQSARNNASMYDTMNTEYRTGQQQNNQVIAANNGYLQQQYMDALNQYLNGFNAYNTLSNNDWQRTLQARQQGEAEKQFNEDLAYRYAALAASQQPMSGGYSLGGGGSSGGGGGSSDSGLQTAVATNKVSDGFVVDRINGDKPGNEKGYDYVYQNTLKDYPWK